MEATNPFLSSENERKPSRQPNLWQESAHGMLPPCELLACELWTVSDVQRVVQVAAEKQAV